MSWPFKAGFRVQSAHHYTMGWLRWQRIHLQRRRPRVNSFVGVIPWRRERLHTPVFWPGEFHGLYSPRGSQSQTPLSDFHFHGRSADSALKAMTHGRISLFKPVLCYLPDGAQCGSVAGKLGWWVSRELVASLVPVQPASPRSEIITHCSCSPHVQEASFS